LSSHLLLTAALLIPTVAVAADAASDPALIIVTGQRQGYEVHATSSATRTDTPLIDVPQSVVAVTRQRIDDQALTGLRDVLRFVPGVTVGQGEGNRDQITIRGQNTTADFFTDGLRDDVQYFRPVYNLDRVEVLKGANALIFGRGGGGGVVNRVLKAPIEGQWRVGVDSSVDTFRDTFVAGDVNAPIAANASARLNAFYESLANHRDFFGGERWAVNPAVGAEVAPGWTAGASYEHIVDDRVSDRGVPTLAGTNAPLRGVRDRFFGVPGVNRSQFEADIARARVDGSLGRGVKWTTLASWGDYWKQYDNVFASGAASGGRVPVSFYESGSRRENVFVQSYLTAKLETGPIRHEIMTGVDYANQATRSYRFDAPTSPRFIDLASTAFPSVGAFTLTSRNRSLVDAVSLYGQDQLELTGWAQLVLGVRWDRFSISGRDLFAGRDFARTDEFVTPRVGVVLKPRANLSIYGSYVKSFLPRSGDQFTTLSITNASLAPESSTNYEVGAKWDPTPALSATFAVFRLDRTNVTTADPVNPVLTTLVGATRTEGVEVALTGRLARGLSTTVGYSYQDAHLRGNGAVRLSQVPEHQFSTWTRYDVTKRLGVGVGVLHQSSQYAAIRTTASTTQLPAFTRLDAAVFYKASDKLLLQANIENLTNTEYFPDAHSNFNISTGAPVNARLSARLRF
jgi:catecholate siderophore receptor